MPSSSDIAYEGAPLIADADSFLRHLETEHSRQEPSDHGKDRHGHIDQPIDYHENPQLASILLDMRDEGRQGSLDSDPLRPRPLNISARTSPSSSPTRSSHQRDIARRTRDIAVGSVRSFNSDGSTESQSSSKVARKASRASRSEPNVEGRPLDYVSNPGITVNEERRTGSMFSFDESEEPLKVHHTTDVGPLQQQDVSIPASHLQKEQTAIKHLSTADIPDRSWSTATKNTIPMSMFKDFDGVHTSASEFGEEISPDRPSFAESRPGSSYAPTGQEPRWVEPPPVEGMVFYPAPVPSSLNMPVKLSKQGNAQAQAKRRSQVIGSMPIEARRSMLGLPDERDQVPEDGRPSEDATARARRGIKRKSVANMKNLPPQLRASLFFDLPSTAQEVEVKHQSAVATLDDMLDASVDAPVDAFMGVDDAHIGRGRKSTTSMMMDLKSEHRLSRASLLSLGADETQSGRAASRASMMTGKRSASADNLSQHGRLDGRNSRASMLSGKRSPSIDYIGEHAKRVSMLSIGDEVQFTESAAGNENRDSLEEHNPTDAESLLDPENKRSSSVLDQIFGAGAEPEEGSHAEAAEDDMVPIDEEALGPPTTLLAELQIRKAKLKERTRTAATAFPNGMHSTLLQLEEVAQIEKSRRKNKRTALAWEDPNDHCASADIDDENVPLGVLFPERNGLIALKAAQSDWDKPLGLIEDRARENNETLAQRQMRLFGIRTSRQPQPLHPWYRRNGFVPSVQQQQHSDDDSEHEEETLAQRTRRLRAEKGLDGIVGDGDDFASEMLSQFGVEKSQRDTPSPDNDSETLGQRRRRLQAEKDEKSNTSRQVSGAKSAISGFNNPSRQHSGEIQAKSPGIYDPRRPSPAASREHLGNADRSRYDTGGFADFVAPHILPPVTSDVESNIYGAPSFSPTPRVAPVSRTSDTRRMSNLGLRSSEIIPYAQPKSNVVPGLLQSNEAQRAASRERILNANNCSSSGLRLRGQRSPGEDRSRSISPAVPSPGLMETNDVRPVSGHDRVLYTNRRSSGGLRLSGHFPSTDDRSRSISPALPSPSLMQISDAHRAASRERIARANRRSSSGLRLSQVNPAQDSPQEAQSPGTPPNAMVGMHTSEPSASRENLGPVNRRSSSGLKLSQAVASDDAMNTPDVGNITKTETPLSEDTFRTLHEERPAVLERRSSGMMDAMKKLTSRSTSFQELQAQLPPPIQIDQKRQQLPRKPVPAARSKQQTPRILDRRRPSGDISIHPRRPSGSKTIRQPSSSSASASMPPPPAPPMRTALGMSAQDTNMNVGSQQRDNIDKWRMEIDFDNLGNDLDVADDKRSIKSIAFI